MTNKIAIYSADYCTNCKVIKMYLDAQGIEYEVKDISNEDLKDELINKGFISIPVLEVNGVCHLVNPSNFKKFLPTT